MRTINHFGRNILTIVSVCALLTTSCKSAEDYFIEGVSYLEGENVTQDLDKAIDLLKKAADKNYIEAYRQIGRAYVRKGDLEEGLKWYEQGVTKGDKTAAVKLGDAYKNGTDDGIKQDYTKAAYYYEKALEIGGEEKSDATVHYNLGYINATADKPDMGKAIAHYTKAIELDDTLSYGFYDLGQIYFWGLGGVKKDYNKAVEYYKKAAELNNPDALYNLAICYQDGKGVGKSSDLKMQYMKKAAEAGNEQAISYLEEVRQQEQRRQAQEARDNQLINCPVCHGRGLTQGTGFQAGSIVSCSLCGGSGVVRYGRARSYGFVR